MVLELRHPYYFLQDDNRVHYLGYLAHNWRALISGSLALFNFHQFLGTPFLAMGQTATLYPPAYLAAGLSKLLFGHIFAAVDIYIILHLVAGGPAMFHFLKKTGVGGRAAFLGGLAWPLNGFAVYMSSNWPVVCPVVVYFPLMLLFSTLVLETAGGLAEICALTAVRLGLFYTGYVQYFIYCVVFETLFLLLCGFFSGKKPGRAALLRYLSSHILTAALALPLLLPMWHLARISADRSVPLPYSDFASGRNKLLLWLQGLVLPIKAGWILRSEIFSRIFRRHSWLDAFLPCYAHVGWVMAFFAVRSLAPRNFKTLTPQAKSAAALLAIALVWSVGLINKILYVIPIMNRFRYNFKLVLFSDFLLIALGVAGYAVFESRRAHKTTVFTVALALTISNFALLYLALPPRNFSNFAEKVPLRIPLPGPDTSGRILAIAPPNSDMVNGTALPTTDYSGLVAFNYATLWGYDYFAGYQVLVPKPNAEATGYLAAPAVAPVKSGELAGMAPHLRCWGVRRYIVANSFLPVYEKDFAALDMRREWNDATRTIFLDPHARPPVYLPGTNDGLGLEYRFSVNSVFISKKSGPAAVAVANVLYNPFFNALVNGVRAQVEPNADGQLSIAMPAGRADAEIYYRDPWFETGLLLSGLALALFAGLAFRL
ncbi:MAG: hypothetical protein PHP45_02110 [Elusimicrobiales bacterium]|nr:hypothetical protein [Elusimicrobiales bacterium]